MKPKTTLSPVTIVVPAFAIGIAMVQRIALADFNQREQAAAKVTGAFLQELSAAMEREMSKGGPVMAILVCSE